ncbi:hypothetical protein E2C01_025599 [Portunus trituberculatus]|uniref:Uncharacterized protein n=1 Tax=Portunus trituberculatus TaxID=210409 RepID=A0A5B7EDC1_PORTR|nr:hypothetical protein [Portunus trituberculatus]
MNRNLKSHMNQNKTSVNKVAAEDSSRPVSLLGGFAKALAKVCIVTPALGYPGKGCGAWCGTVAGTAAVGAASTGVSTPLGVPAVSTGRLQGVLAVLHLQLPVLFDSLLLSTPCLPVLAATVDLFHVLLLFPEKLHLGESGVGKLDVLLGKEEGRAPRVAPQPRQQPTSPRRCAQQGWSSDPPWCRAGVGPGVVGPGNDVTLCLPGASRPHLGYRNTTAPGAPPAPSARGCPLPRHLPGILTLIRASGGVSTKARIQKHFTLSPRPFSKITEMFRRVSKNVSSLDVELLLICHYNRKIPLKTPCHFSYNLLNVEELWAENMVLVNTKIVSRCIWSAVLQEGVWARQVDA